MSGRGPVGTITRGTTNPNRLRRCDRWLTETMGTRLRRAPTAPVVVDLGYGADPVTTLELRERLRPIRPDVRVVGIEIDPARVGNALPLADDTLTFRLGGFEIPLDPDVDGTDRALVIRAFNVLRQYNEDAVPGAWRAMLTRLAPGGILIDGTCDELGRLATWVTVTAEGPCSLTLSWRLRGLATPSVIAERLPKALIHRNVPGERVHDLLGTLDEQWSRQAGHAAFGVRQRFLATVAASAAEGWPLAGGRSRWRLGELTVPWACVAPRPDQPATTAGERAPLDRPTHAPPRDRGGRVTSGRGVPPGSGRDPSPGRGQA